MARGNMGLVEVQVNMSPMACPEHEEGRLGSKGLELMRILELLFRDCGVIDLESLCLRAFKQVKRCFLLLQINTKVMALDYRHDEPTFYMLSAVSSRSGRFVLMSMC